MVKLHYLHYIQTLQTKIRLKRVLTIDITPLTDSHRKVINDSPPAPLPVPKGSVYPWLCTALLRHCIYSVVTHRYLCLYTMTTAVLLDCSLHGAAFSFCLHPSVINFLSTQTCWNLESWEPARHVFVYFVFVPLWLVL